MKIREKIREALLWSQRYTQTDMIYLAKGGFWLTLGQIVIMVASFFLAIAFANFLPKETYGDYQYVLSVVSILTVFTLPGMNWAVAQAVARDYEGSFMPGLKMKIQWGLVAGLLSLGVTGYYFLNKNFTLTVSFLITAFFLPLLDSPTIFHGYLKGKKLFKQLTKYLSITELISAGCLIGILFLTNSLFLILLTHFLSYTALRFLFLKNIIKKFPPNKKEDPKTLSYGKHLTLMDIANLVAARLDYILLWHFLGAATLAIYSFALILPQKIIGLLGGVINSLAMPKLSNKAQEDLKATLPKKAFQLFLALIPIVALYIILAPLFYKIFFPKYLASVFYSQIFALSILLFPEVLFSTALAAQMKKKQLYIYKLTSPLIRIIFLLILTPLYGIVGAISAILIANTAALSLVIFLFKQM